MHYIPVEKVSQDEVMWIHCGYTFNSSSSKPVPMIIYNFTSYQRSISGPIGLNTRCVHSPLWLTDRVLILSLRSAKSTLSRVFCQHLPSCWRSLHPQLWPSSDEKTSRDLIAVNQSDVYIRVIARASQQLTASYDNAQ